MSDNQPTLGPLQSASTPEPERSRVPLIAGVVIALAIVAVVIVLSRSGKERTEQPGMEPADPYAANLVISDVKMSTAENFAGATVTYLEGKIQNNGSRTLTAVTVQIGFVDQLNELVQKDAMPLSIITAREPYIDTQPVSTAPLKPGDTREFRLTFEHISVDWNRNYPEVRVIHVAG